MRIAETRKQYHADSRWPRALLKQENSTRLTPVTPIDETNKTTVTD